VFENMVLRNVFRLMWDVETGAWRKLHNVNGLYCSQNIVRVTKLRRIEWAGHVERMGRSLYEFWWGNLGKSVHLGEAGIDGRMILRWIFRKCDVVVWTGPRWRRIEPRFGNYE